jgi:serine/threonine protein kinase
VVETAPVWVGLIDDDSEDGGVPMSRAGVAIGGRYRLQEALASGGMGTVWRGWDERLHRVVAVKQLHLDPSLPAAERDIAVTRMMREARITAQLHHPNAVQVFDVIDEDGRPNLIMQFIPSRSLQDVLRTDGPLAPSAAARLGVQVASALTAAHRVGIVHRDVKPGNVLIDEEGVARITDFGIAYTHEDATLTSAGMVTGTPAYLAPEVARGARSDAASDVWSLGATLYATVEGHPPFGSEGTPMAVLHRVASGRFEPPTRSGQLTPVLQSMLSPDPAARPSMMQVVDALSRLTDAPTTNLRAAEPTMPTSLDHTRSLPVEGPPSRSPRHAAPPFLPPTAPPPAFARPPEPARPAGRRSWVPVLAAALVAILAAVVAIVLLADSGGGGGTGGGSSGTPTAGGSTSVTVPKKRSSAAARTSASSTTTEPSETTTTTTNPPVRTSSRTTTAPPAGGAPTADELASAVTDYYSLIPGDLDAAWQRLTPAFQNGRAGGRASFDAYWNSIERVDVGGVSGQPPSSATATLTYHYRDGRTVTDTTTFRLVRQDGVLKIDNQS